MPTLKSGSPTRIRVKVRARPPEIADGTDAAVALTALAQEGEATEQAHPAGSGGGDRVVRIVSASPVSQQRGQKRVASDASGDGSGGEGVARSSGKLRVSSGGASDGGGREVPAAMDVDVRSESRQLGSVVAGTSAPVLPGFVSGGALEGTEDDMETEGEDGGGGGGARAVEISAVKVCEGRVCMCVSVFVLFVLVCFLWDTPYRISRCISMSEGDRVYALCQSLCYFRPRLHGC